MLSFDKYRRSVLEGLLKDNIKLESLSLAKRLMIESIIVVACAIYTVWLSAAYAIEFVINGIYNVLKIFRRGA